MGLFSRDEVKMGLKKIREQQEQADKIAEDNRWRNAEKKKFNDVVDFAKENKWMVFSNEIDDENERIDRVFLSATGNIVCLSIDKEDGTSVTSSDYAPLLGD